VFALVQTYSLTRIVGHLLTLENEPTRDEEMCAVLRTLIHQVKIMHAKYWIHEGRVTPVGRLVIRSKRTVSSHFPSTSKSTFTFEIHAFFARRLNRTEKINTFSSFDKFRRVSVFQNAPSDAVDNYTSRVFISDQVSTKFDIFPPVIIKNDDCATKLTFRTKTNCAMNLF